MKRLPPIHPYEKVWKLPPPAVCLRVACLCFFLWITVGLGAQTDLKLTHLTIEDGLSYRWGFGVEQDSLGLLWIATYDGLNRYDGHRFTVYRPELPDSTSSELKRIRQVCNGPQGTLWIVTIGGDLLRFHPANRRFEMVCRRQPEFGVFGFYDFGDLGFWAILYEEGSGKFWLASAKEGGRRFEPLSSFESSPRDPINLISDNKQRIWCWTDRSYIVWDVSTQSKAIYPFNAIPGAEISHPVLPIDRQRRFWYPSPEGRFRTCPLPRSLAAADVEQYLLDNVGGLWFITRDKQTFRYTEAGRWEDFGRLDFLNYDLRPPFQDSEGNLWLAHFYGVTQLSRERRLFDNYLKEPLNEVGASPASKSVYVMWEEPDGSLVINIAGEKAFRLQPEAPPAKPIGDSPPQPSPLSETALQMIEERVGKNEKQILQTFAFFEDKPRRVLWFSPEVSRSVHRLDLQTGEHRLFNLSSTPFTIWAVQPLNGFLWIGTEQGLYRLDPESGDFERYTTTQGLPHRIVYSLLPDDQGKLWLGTHYGLCRFNPQTGETLNYYVEDGLTHNEFNRRSALKTRDGKMYFGGLNGVNAFYPDSLVQNDRRYQPGLHLLEFSKIAGRLDTAVVLDYPLDKLEELRLRPSDHTFSFRFALNSYIKSSQNKYLYYLDGWEAPWSNETRSGEATYLHLPPGRYTLRVRAADPFGNPARNEIELPIYLPQVWYRRWWAWAGYLAFLLLGAYLLYRRQLERQEALRLQELDEVKTKLYTNITHEFRTPLTVILGLADQLGNGAWQSSLKESTKTELLNKLGVIRRNGDNLLQLVNQLLDLAKLEAGKLSLHLVQDDIIHYLRYVAASFHSFAAGKKVELHFLPHTQSFLMDFDRERMLNILSNLLSNAVKFTPEGGHIYLQTAATTDRLSIIIKDTGAGIPEDQLPHIFERFYQVDDSSTRPGEGTGIGLTFAYELVKMMKGDINVISRVGEGAEFTITLPVSREAPRASEEAEIPGSIPTEPPFASPQSALPEKEGNSDHPLLLIVEDNTDIVAFIRSCLAGAFRITTAADGQEGIDKAIAEVPDLIISDVMMPRKDGFELVRTLKSDERSSHIPIVLLTAKADIASKLEGLERGADAYLPKPFHQRELQLRLRNLLEQQRRMQQKYAGRDFSSSHTTAPPASDDSREDAFLSKAAGFILEHLDNAEFGNEALAQLMTMSESQLNRKIKALTGKTLAVFIRSLRLQEGKKLLQNTGMNISEVAYAVGFTDPAYFSRTFSKEFGQAPSSFRK